jgi:hypothetical protein
VVEDYEEEAVGGLSVRIHSPYVHEFDPYYFALSPYTNHRNPWFREFWQWKFNCSLHSLAELQSLPIEQRQKLVQLPRCSGTERLADKYKQDTKMAFVIKAIWTMAYGLHSMHRSLCPNSTFLCKEMIPVNGSVRSQPLHTSAFSLIASLHTNHRIHYERSQCLQIFLQHLLNVSFVWQNEHVLFDQSGDPPGRYDIMNFQKKTNGSHDYEMIGKVFVLVLLDKLKLIATLSHFLFLFLWRMSVMLLTCRSDDSAIKLIMCKLG